MDGLTDVRVQQYTVYTQLHLQPQCVWVYGYNNTQFTHNCTYSLSVYGVQQYTVYTQLYLQLQCVWGVQQTVARLSVLATLH